jgi:hypothetical protein
MAITSDQIGTVVVGYFATGETAHSAVSQLVARGFEPSQIGAAFHIGAGIIPSTQPDVGGSLRGELGTTQSTSHMHEGESFGGAASSGNDVQVAALGGGAGTPFEGAGRPGPIPGSSLAHTGLPSELKSTMPHDPPMPQSAAVQGSLSRTDDSSRRLNDPEQNSELWSNKMRHILTQKQAETKPVEQRGPKAPVTSESQNFGTGEGHLILPNTYRYSQPAFENSLSGSGLQNGHARHLSQRIGHSGAIVTVHASGRAEEAEQILEAAGGQVRFSAMDFSETTNSRNDGMVEVFGTMHSTYSTHLD